VSSKKDFDTILSFIALFNGRGFGVRLDPFFLVICFHLVSLGTPLLFFSIPLFVDVTTLSLDAKKQKKTIYFMMHSAY
jgi:hypothetical protein